MKESYRANAQANRWNSEEGTPGRYKGKIVFEVPAGPDARKNILDFEKGNAERLRDAGEIDPDKHTRP